MLGFWGLHDGTVPAVGGEGRSVPGDPTVALQPVGSTGGRWYYSTARNTTDVWARARMGNTRVSPTTTTSDNSGSSTNSGSSGNSGSIGMIRKDVTDTWVPGGKTTASPSVTCTGYDAPVSVVECMFDGGHDCDMPYIPTTGWAFMNAHSKGYSKGRKGEKTEEEKEEKETSKRDRNGNNYDE